MSGVAETVVCSEFRPTLVSLTVIVRDITTENRDSETEIGLACNHLFRRLIVV